MQSLLHHLENLTFEEMGGTVQDESENAVHAEYGSLMSSCNMTPEFCHKLKNCNVQSTLMIIRRLKIRRTMWLVKGKLMSEFKHLSNYLYLVSQIIKNEYVSSRQMPWYSS